ncbi:hypothetical protein BT69DRAFT_1275701 [Atractiella rhizophila]|nr:hypothetical protein BT69DRAFT_1275701 [Atractiella rhizophila]
MSSCTSSSSTGLPPLQIAADMPLKTIPADFIHAMNSHLPNLRGSGLRSNIATWIIPRQNTPLTDASLCICVRHQGNLEPKVSLAGRSDNPQTSFVKSKAIPEGGSMLEKFSRFGIGAE